MLTIVMYHYVRELPFTRHPRLKARLVSEFRGQLAYLLKHYRVVTMAQVLAALHEGGSLPGNAALLTFDDGYAEHYATVFPILDALGLQGSFFAPVRAVTHHELLDVNKVHLLLDAIPDAGRLLAAVFAGLADLRGEFGLPDGESLYAAFTGESRYDPREILFVKRLLQRDLPPAARAALLGRLLDEHVGVREDVLARELYVTTDQLKTMVRHGMVVGSHGYGHEWLDSLPPQAQREEIGRSLEFLDFLGVSLDNWAMCYPYGAYNDGLLAVMREFRCGLGLTTRVGLASLDPAEALVLPRLDTNDLPTNEHDTPNEWTLAAR